MGAVRGALSTLDATGYTLNIWMDTAESGFYLFTANTADNTWSHQEITKVSVSGDFNGWSIDSDLMQYDVDAKVWKAVIDINYIEWGIQIILNDDWDMMWTKKADGVLQYGKGVNIVPSEMGVYLLTIDTWDMGHITYTLEKQ